jgi:predicted nucleic acid-binding Zn ribbon protein
MASRGRRRPARQGTPETPRALLDELFRSLRLEEMAQSLAACRAFGRAAGPRIGRRARAERLRGATLYVRVSSSAWAHELHALKSELLDKLGKEPGGEAVLDLRFSVGPVEELPDWVTLGTKPPLAPQPRVQPPQPLSLELARALEEVVDPELRQALRHAAEARPTDPPR